MSVVDYNAVIYCQSTDLVGLPTSIEIRLMSLVDEDKEVASFYAELEYDESVEVSEKATAMSQHLQGFEKESPEMVIYKMYQFLAKYVPMDKKGSIRPIIHGTHSLETLKRFCEHTGFPHTMDVFNSVNIDTQQYCHLLNDVVFRATRIFPYTTMDFSKPSVAYNDVARVEEVGSVPTKGYGIYKIYRSIIKNLTEDVVSSKTEQGISLCPSCKARAYEFDNCFLCGYSKK